MSPSELLILLALGAAPRPSVAPARPSPPGLAARRVDQVVAEQLCEPLVEGLVLCLERREAGVGEVLTRAQLAAAGGSEEDAWRQARERAARALGPGRPARTAIADMPQVYWLSAEGDGLDHAALAHPDALAHLGTGARVGLPTPDVLVAWPAGDEELDRVMAVAVARMAEADPEGRTADVLVWSREEKRWQVWGRASRPAGASPAPDAGVQPGR